MAAGADPLERVTMPANWKNRTLWTGDNLDIMRGMNSESVDLIYLDPPFNSNRDYAAPIGSEAAGAAFKDTWTLSDVDEAWHGEVADREPVLYAIIDAAGLSHGKGMKSYLIMMAVRLMEMRRILKDAGSIYLHCDPTASHYLKTLMDAIMGRTQFRSEVVWKRSGGKSDALRWGSTTDRLLFYSKSDAHTWNRQYVPHSTDYATRTYRYDDGDGRGPYTTMPLHASGIRHGESGNPWKGYSPEESGNHWRTPTQGVMNDYIQEHDLIPGWPSTYPGVHDRLEALDQADLIAWSTNGVPRLKTYLSATKGVACTDLVTDIPMASGHERVGYPTQKPVVLLDRIIRASSNEGDMVLDPFCGCATALVAADRLDRQWAGIDLSPLAARLVLKRLREDRGPLFDDVIHRKDVPYRTDLGTLPNYRTHKHTLYGRQEGHCAGCQVLFPFRNLTVDHVVARSRGGHDHLDNLQLLCGACNSMKGAGPQEQLVAKLKAEGIRK